MTGTHAPGASTFTFHDYNNLQDAGRALARDAAQWLRAALARDGRACFAAPGGKSPTPFFAELAQTPLDWAHVSVTLTDERFVPLESADSNAGLLARTLLQGPARSAHFIAPPLDRASLSEAADGWDTLLRAAPVFDFVVLGMGDDGHFASLFPGSAALQAGLDPHSHRLVLPVEDRSPQRLSLTLRALLRTQHLALLVSGAAKRDILDAVARNDPDATKLPIASLLRHSPVLPAIYWGAHT